MSHFDNQVHQLILGGTGQLGLTFLYLTDNRVAYFPNRMDVDFLAPEKLADLVMQCRPKVIINTVAYTQVDQAETKPMLAYQINSLAVEALASAAKRVGALLVHFSTDYVFDGSGNRAWREDDAPAPLNVYGLSKWRGEQAILDSGCRHLILRTSWLHSPHRHNFLKTVLCLGLEKDSLPVICDQIGSPTSAAMLAAVTLRAITMSLDNPGLDGTYHVAASGFVSWYHYADFIFKEAYNMGILNKVPAIIPIASGDYVSAAPRPLNSRLDASRFCQTFGLSLPFWKIGVRDTLQLLVKEQ